MPIYDFIFKTIVLKIEILGNTKKIHLEKNDIDTM